MDSFLVLFIYLVCCFGIGWHSANLLSDRGWKLAVIFGVSAYGVASVLYFWLV